MKKTIIDQQPLQILAPETDDELSEWIPRIVPVYKQVFGDEVWKEGWKCTRCKRKYALSDPNCADGTCCAQKLAEFYSDQEVAVMLRDLLVKRYQLRMVVDQAEQVVGFQWGWKETLTGMNTKLELWPEVLDRLREELKRKELYDEQMYYWSESGVLPGFRRRNLAKLMYEDVRKSLVVNTRYKLLRTSPQSPQYQLSRKQGDEVVFNYTDNTRDRRMMDDRVLLAGKL